MKILVTGGAGFIGSHVVDKCLEKHQVFVIDNFSTGKNANNLATYHTIDINDTTSLDNIFNLVKPDIVVHLAAQVSVLNSQINPILDAQININGTLNLLSMSKKYNVKKFIAASSAAVYGNIESPISEDCNPKPQSNYGVSKLTMENYIKISGLNYLILRFSNVYGERQNINGEAGVVTIFEEQMKNNKPVVIYGDGEQVRDFIYVKDLADIIARLIEMDTENDTLNISTGSGFSINNLFNVLKEKYNYKMNPVYKSVRNGDIKVSILRNEKLLKYLPSYSFNKSLCYYKEVCI